MKFSLLAEFAAPPVLDEPAQELSVSGEELTERFVRGDASRNTEGSGLGLYIAKNLTQAQHGEFQIQLDGDLFKIILDFPEYERPSQEETAVPVETIEEA